MFDGAFDNKVLSFHAALFEEHFDSAPQCQVVLDPDFLIAKANRSGRAALGMSGILSREADRLRVRGVGNGERLKFLLRHASACKGAPTGGRLTQPGFRTVVLSVWELPTKPREPLFAVMWHSVSDDDAL